MNRTWLRFHGHPVEVQVFPGPHTMPYIEHAVRLRPAVEAMFNPLAGFDPSVPIYERCQQPVLKIRLGRTDYFLTLPCEHNLMFSFNAGVETLAQILLIEEAYQDYQATLPCSERPPHHNPDMEFVCAESSRPASPSA